MTMRISQIVRPRPMLSLGVTSGFSGLYGC
jgi:hypothetical protein